MTKAKSVMVMLRCTYDNGVSHGPGEVISLDGDEAARLIAAGHAEKAADPVQEKLKVPVAERKGGGSPAGDGDERSGTKAAKDAKKAESAPAKAPEDEISGGEADDGQTKSGDANVEKIHI
ncbi:MAG: hypothetical protein LBP61_09525 [Desulfovibrio sp.]|jgi:hypothetical protein|nr:hypothetical protein [Desulfovibrio sp.]